MAAPAILPDRRERFELLKAELSAKPVRPVEGLIRTALPELDRLLGGGFSAGTIVALEGKGCWSLAAGLTAGMTRRSLVAILDDGGLYPPALVEAGASLERILIVPARKALSTARAADILLRSRICRMVLMPAVALRDAIWERLAQLAHRSGALLIVVAERVGAALSAAAGVCLRCSQERILMHGRHGLWGTVAGFELCVGVRKQNHKVTGGTVYMRVVKETQNVTLR